MERDRWGLNRSQRMQLKAFICLLGVLLIIMLLLGKLVMTLVHREGGQEVVPPIHIPIVQLFRNVWVMEVDEEGIVIFREGNRERYSWGMVAADDGAGASSGDDGAEAGGERQVVYDPGPSVREQVADVELTDGRVTLVRAKTDKINGKILSADAEGIEVEGYGRLPLASDCRGYRLYDSLKMCTARDLLFGYAFTDLCMENGEVCGILMVKEDAMEYIRVLIKESDYNGLFHEQPRFTCDVGFTVVYGAYGDQKREAHGAGEEVTLSYDSAYFETDRIYVVPDVLTGKVTLRSCNRSQGIPSYRGTMEFLRTEDGIVAVNEVLLEEYLYSVVPSEMPASYPYEALRAQAICARTYAYGSMLRAGYPQYGAHVDDSTSYQVYNNILEQESTTTAAKETYGQLLYTGEGSPAGTYYYSTSCGVGSDATVWKTEVAPTLTYLKPKALSKSAMAAALASEGDALESVDLGESMRDEEAFAAFIGTVNPDDFEAGEGWYRWTYQVEALNREHMLEVLQRRYAANSRLVLTWNGEEYVSEEIRELGDIKEIYIEERGSGGVADELVIETDASKIKVISEHNIRYVLNDGEADVVRQNGSRVASPNLLPSGFFVITTGKENGNVVEYSLSGGGFGHGVGMSQNGAKEMAKSGYTAEEILLYFYEGCSVEKIYE